MPPGPDFALLHTFFVTGGTPQISNPKNTLIFGRIERHKITRGVRIQHPKRLFT
jgi:hypothetical protein